MRAPVLRLEDLVQSLLVRLARRRGRAVHVQGYPGLATAGRVRVGGRVLVGTAPVTRAAARATSWSALRSNLAQFLTVEVPRARVRVDVAGRSEVVVADREGYVDAELPGLTLPPGRHTATLTPVDPAGPAASVVVHAPDPAADLVVVSDIDDTIIDSGIARGLRATVATALLRDSAARVPLEGAPELYRALARPGQAGPDRPFVYLSTSPWNLVGFLQRFLQSNGFPDGPLLLTDWGPGAGGLFRIATRTHKLTALQHLAEVLPDLRFVLVGDSGQEDPEIYAAFALEHPGRVAAVYIRRAGVPGPARQERLDECARSLDRAGVRFLLADDSSAMLRHAQDAGLVHR